MVDIPEVRMFDYQKFEADLKLHKVFHLVCYYLYKHIEDNDTFDMYTCISLIKIMKSKGPEGSPMLIEAIKRILEKTHYFNTALFNLLQNSTNNDSENSLKSDEQLANFPFFHALDELHLEIYGKSLVVNRSEIKQTHQIALAQGYTLGHQFLFKAYELLTENKTKELQEHLLNKRHALEHMKMFMSSEMQDLFQRIAATSNGSLISTILEEYSSCFSENTWNSIKLILIKSSNEFEQIIPSISDELLNLVNKLDMHKRQVNQGIAEIIDELISFNQPVCTNQALTQKYPTKQCIDNADGVNAPDAFLLNSKSTLCSSR